jgi:hypothetical protein
MSLLGNGYFGSSLPVRLIYLSSSLALDCLLFSKLSGCVFVFGSGYALSLDALSFLVVPLSLVAPSSRLMPSTTRAFLSASARSRFTFLACSQPPHRWPILFQYGTFVSGEIAFCFCFLLFQSRLPSMSDEYFEGLSCLCVPGGGIFSRQA